MRPQYRQRQTSELNEQGKNDIPVRCQGAYAKFRRFLEILQNILISKLSLFICINIDQSRRILFDFLRSLLMFTATVFSSIKSPYITVIIYY